jgi:NAD(P)H-dependent flavin oxidoreductase YrpB (nitropropane dioxygenase family)
MLAVDTATYVPSGVQIMITTPVCALLDIEHPIALGAMGSASSPAMTAAVSRAGGLGAMGCHYLTPDQIRERTAATRKETNKPFGLNFLLFDTREEAWPQLSISVRR